MSLKNRGRYREDVFEQNGFRWFVVTLVISILFGFVLRQATSSRRMTEFLRKNLEHSQIAENLSFSEASLSLADGWWPEVAFLLERVEWRTAPSCQDAAPIQMKRMRVPIRLLPLMKGEAVVALAKVEDLTVDLDTLKTSCRKVETAAVSIAAVANSDQPRVEPVPEVPKPAAPAPTIEPEMRKRLQAMIRGLRVDRAELFFENRMKSVVLEDFSAVWSGDDLEVATGVRFPPATVFGEALPPFLVSGTLRPQDISVDVRADLNEGTLEGSAQLHPVRVESGAMELESEVRVAVADLPLSVMTPLLRKSGMVNERFKPRFAWLDCAAEVKGLFSRLLVQNAVHFSQCEVSGHIGRVRVESALREPTGVWHAPMGKDVEIVFDQLSIGQTLDTFAEEGPRGVFSEYGNFTGRLVIADARKASVSGELKGAQVKFASGGGSALQGVHLGRIDGALSAQHLDFQISKVALDGGETDMTAVVGADLGDQGIERATVRIDAEHMKLNSRVEKLLFTGPVENLQLSTQLSFRRGEFDDLKLKLEASGLKGAEIEAEKIRMSGKMNRAAGGAAVDIDMDAPMVALTDRSPIFKLLQPALFDWSAPEGLLKTAHQWPFRKVSVKGRLDDAGFTWARASVELPVDSISGAKKITFRSKGKIERAQLVEIELDALYPSQKRLRWSVSGSWLKLAHTGLSPEIEAGRVPPLKVLGL
ncbi:MAG: hypothetical protein JNJ49_10490 [Bdellovibrionaceae bacterium]|nr:hypothetical protein [Pseudobdellovibrionaceae bacterium]